MLCQLSVSRLLCLKGRRADQAQLYRTANQQQQGLTRLHAHSGQAGPATAAAAQPEGRRQRRRKILFSDSKQQQPISQADQRLQGQQGYEVLQQQTWSQDAVQQPQAASRKHSSRKHSRCYHNSKCSSNSSRRTVRLQPKGSMRAGDFVQQQQQQQQSSSIPPEDVWIVELRHLQVRGPEANVNQL
jgi:hypothetical protein